MAADKVFYATGRRKTSAARVFLKPGAGKITVNGKSFDEYFVTPSTRNSANSALKMTDSDKKFDAYVTVKGGGVNSQAEAVRHGMARALCVADEGHRPTLKKAGLLTRDSRMVERKKYGQHKARKSTQFSKR